MQPQYPPPPPPPPPMQPGPPTGSKRIPRPVIWGGAVLVAAVVLFGYREITQPSPKDSFERALAAYRQHDLGSFKTYVDLQSILGDAIEQAVADGTASQDLGTKIIAQAVVAVAKQTWLPMYTPALEQMVVQG